jgi:lysophospholipase L1-like esterase
VVQAGCRQERFADERRRRQRRYGGRGLMQFNSGAILGLTMLAGLLTAALAPVRAEDAPPPQSCEVPPYLLTTESSLSKVADAAKSGRPLDILVVGSRSSTINTSEASAYPARLQATLREKLPLITVNVSVEIQSKKTAEEVASSLVKLVEDKKPTLVVWQTGTVDAMRSIDPDDFRAAVDEGVAALQNAGTDVVLMNLQYSPRTETMISAPPYLDNMRVVAQQHDVPLFDRFAIMHQWNDAGDFDLFSAFHGIELAKRVHDCLGRALSKFVIDAAHLDPAQQN